MVERKTVEGKYRNSLFRWEGGQGLEGTGRDGRGRGQKGIKTHCDMYKLPTLNVIVMHYKHDLLKNKTKNTGFEF